VGRILRTAGLTALAGAAWVLIASEADWISSGLSDAAFPPLAFGGALCLAVGIVLGVLNPLSRRLGKGHCERCGAPIERGQVYCLDHLRDTVNEYQDALRRGETLRSRKNA
jgi:hypothetical protein